MPIVAEHHAAFHVYLLRLWDTDNSMDKICRHCTFAISCHGNGDIIVPNILLVLYRYCSN
jgi:hypothetical protein